MLSLLRMLVRGAKEMAQQLIALVASPEVPGSIPSLHMEAQECL